MKPPSIGEVNLWNTIKTAFLREFQSAEHSKAGLAAMLEGHMGLQ
nr:MAG TPA: hypothetical protein [Caudoviricetes sp.]